LRGDYALGIKNAQESIAKMTFETAIRLAGVGLCVVVSAGCIGAVGFGLLFIF